MHSWHHQYTAMGNILMVVFIHTSTALRPVTQLFVQLQFYEPCPFTVCSSLTSCPVRRSLHCVLTSGRARAGHPITHIMASPAGGGGQSEAKLSL